MKKSTTAVKPAKSPKTKKPVTNVKKPTKKAVCNARAKK